MTTLRSYASLSHFQEHMAPVIDALSATTQPVAGVHAPQGRSWGQPLPIQRRDDVWLVAGAADVRRLGPGVRSIMVSHGAGQAYHGDPAAASSPSYAGGDGMDDVILFLCPSETDAERWRARYPDTPAVAVGVPKLDSLHAKPRLPEHPPTVAVTFHWPNTLCPESMWALPHYRSHLHDLRTAVHDRGGEVIGHGHPRAWRQLRREWTQHGIRPVEHLADVFDQADLLVVDNSSAGPEFASLGRPIVWLSAPWYRREVDHQGRFWNWVEGMPHVEHPDDLVAVVLATLADPDATAPARVRMVADAYSHVDGHAAQRAATAILEAI